MYNRKKLFHCTNLFLQQTKQYHQYHHQYHHQYYQLLRNNTTLIQNRHQQGLHLLLQSLTFTSNNTDTNNTHNSNKVGCTKANLEYHQSKTPFPTKIQNIRTIMNASSSNDNVSSNNPTEEGKKNEEQSKSSDVVKNTVGVVATATATATTTTTDKTNDNAQDDQKEGEELNTNNSNKRKHNAIDKKKAAWTQKWKQKKEDRQNNGPGGDKNKNKRNRRQPSTDITWSAKTKEIHDGSFACPEMQSLFNVHVDIPLPASSPSSSSSPSPSSSHIHGGETNNETTTTNDSANNAVTNVTNGEDENSKQPQEQESKLPKKKVALFIGFIGTKYIGMQMNKGQRTIQAEIELALYKAKLISPSNFGYPNKYSWSSSARTDKGVHSCAQVCSVKIMIPTEDMNVITDMINKELPDDIVMLDVVRTARSFVAKTARDKVRYQYMLPSFMIQDYKAMRELLQSIVGREGLPNSLQFSQHPT